MNDVFLDTVGMIAVWDDTDQWHSGAKAAYDLLFSQGRKLVTTPLALYECGNASARRTGTGTSVVCSVVPMLSIRNGARAVEFYKSAFGVIEVYRVEDPAGWVVKTGFWLFRTHSSLLSFASPRTSFPPPLSRSNSLSSLCAASNFPNFL